MTEKYISEIETSSKIVTNKDNKSKLIVNKPGLKRKIVQNIHEEDKYLEHLDKIIQRDFFPDLDQLRASSDFLDAVEKKDVDRMHKIQRELSRMNTNRTCNDYPVDTPGTFDTPVPTSSSGDPITDFIAAARKKLDDELLAHNPEKKEIWEGIGLDDYLAKNTSEDNASFAQLLQEAEKKRRAKMSWCYENAAAAHAAIVQPSIADTSKLLALPSSSTKERANSDSDEEDTKITGATSVTAVVQAPPKPNHIEMWSGYRVHNNVMFPPEGVPHTADEIADIVANRNKVAADNTRFKRPVASIQEALARNRMAQANANANSANLMGRVGPDGKEIRPSATPGVGGFRFVEATPSPIPGAGNETPGMTWGEIESTPFRLSSGGDTPLVRSGDGGSLVPGFRMADTPQRDKLGMELAEKAIKGHRAKKEKAVHQIRSKLVSPASRLSTLSPAAQRLFTSKLQRSHRFDSCLRSTYSPSISGSSRRPTSSLVSYRSQRDPGSSRSSLSGHVTRPETPLGDGLSHAEGSASTKRKSVTDNLLNLK